MILGCYCTKRSHDSYYLQRYTHLCLKNKPSKFKFKGVGTRKDKHNCCKSALCVVLAISDLRRELGRVPNLN